jgi:hypothetical protein
MRTILSVFSALLLLATAPFLSQAGQEPGTDKPPFSLSISGAQDVVQAGSAVTVKVALTNTSDHKIGVVADSDGRGPIDCRIEIRDTQDKMVRDAKPHVWKDKNGRTIKRIYVGASSAMSVGLQPGQTLSDEFPVNKRFDLTEPGKYSVQASRYDSETKTWVKSNTITVTVTQ